MAITITTKDETRIYYKDRVTGGPHGMCTTEKDRVNTELLAFIKGTL